MLLSLPGLNNQRPAYIVHYTTIASVSVLRLWRLACEFVLRHASTDMMRHSGPRHTTRPVAHPGWRGGGLRLDSARPKVMMDGAGGAARRSIAASSAESHGFLLSTTIEDRKGEKRENTAWTIYGCREMQRDAGPADEQRRFCRAACPTCGMKGTRPFWRRELPTKNSKYM